MSNDGSWQELYAAAMLELDHAKLRIKIDVAEAAIREAREKLAGGTVGDAEQMQALAAALGNLQTLQRVEFGKPVPVESQGVTSA